jgi:folylpolyglutamate synthase/dihydropteroate synthase
MTAHHARKVTIERDPFQALERAIKIMGANDAVFVTGSLYLVGDIRTHWDRSSTTAKSQA